jgi:hypothetical protein
MKAFRLAMASVQLLSAFCSPVSAGSFRNGYLSFELPPAWKCNSEGVAWVCEDTSEGDQKTALIVMAAKARGSEDRLDAFEDLLSATKPLIDGNGVPTGRSSTLEFVRREAIGERTWVHSRQFESEVPSYYTDYLATVDDQIAILITFSAEREFFQTAFERFYPSIATIRTLKLSIP